MQKEDKKKEKKDSITKKRIKEENAQVKKRRRRFTKTFYQHNKINFIIAFIILMVNSLLDIVLAYLMQELMDTATRGNLHRLLELLVVGGVFFLVNFLTLLIIRLARNRFIRRAMRQYKDYSFSKITNKSISSFADETTSRYISALTNDATSIEQKYLLGNFTLVCRVLWFFGALAMMFWYNWKMTLVIIGLSLLPITISILLGGKLASEEKYISDRNESFISMVKDLLSGYTVIKSFKAEKEVSGLFNANNKDLENKKNLKRMTEDLINIISMESGFLVQMGVFFYGAYLAIIGDITAGVVIAFVQLMNYVLIPVREIPALIANRKAAVGLIDKLATAVESNVEREGLKVEPDLQKGISFENVSFGYNADELVLKDINLEFKSGKSYAIVGGSGSGKTTLLNLLLGSYESYKGEIRFDDVELRNISLDSLYDMLSIIQQNVFVFDSTIKDNITLFKEFDHDKVEDAIERAGLKKLIKDRSESYQCGENGVGLSGGERQRISIARCLLRKTPVLLMDEATAALDAATAMAVSNSILNIEGLTRIIVTHKLEENLLKKYDEIIVLRHGRICEIGTFDELLAKKDYFYSLFVVSKE